MAILPQPWKPSFATSTINKISRDPKCSMSYAVHVSDRLRERGLIISDILYVLKNGFVYDEPQPSTLPDFFKYRVDGQSPNSGSRYLRVIAIPDQISCQIKVITIMWRDED